MAKAIIARWDGDEYQALYFWYLASDLFHPDTNIKKISYEYDLVRSFDDVIVEYEQPISDEHNRMIDTEFYQIKYHVIRDGEITYTSLIDPSFIHATKVSFLEKLKNAVNLMKDHGRKCRFNLVTPWGIPAHDPLA